jgi:uncharacterized membrane protein YkvA (DUF1232 family)
MENQYPAIRQRIEIGFQAFLSGGDQAFGAVRALPRGAQKEILVYVENAGDFLVPPDAIETVDSQKVIFDGEKLDRNLRQAIDHAHDAEEQDVPTRAPTRPRTDSLRSAEQPTGDRERYPTPSIALLFAAATEGVSRRIASRLLHAFSNHRDRIRQAVRDLPERMQRVTNQTRLATELVDDFQAGVYRGVAWGCIALLAGALVYVVSPADAIPDVIPWLGTLDDLLVTSLALRLVRRQLERYCAFKGYDPVEYFG